MSIPRPTVRQQLLAQLASGPRNFVELARVTGLDEGVVALGLTTLERSGRVKRHGIGWRLVERKPDAVTAVST